MKNIKAVQIGTGKMSRYTMRYLLEKGGVLVGAFDINKDIIGKSVHDLFNEVNSEVKVNNITTLDESLKELKPNVAIVTTMSLLSDVYEVIKICASNGVNVITTCEEAFDSYNSNPKLTNELDRIAKVNNCTITGSGYQDVYWGNLISIIGGSTFKIKEIKGSSSYNVEDYGIALAKAHGAGLSISEFDKEIASVDKISDEERKEIIESGNYLPSYMWNVNGWLISKLGLSLKHQTQKTVPTTYKDDLFSKTLNQTVKKGDATGMSAIVETETVEGIKITSECIGKIYSNEDFDKNEWTIIGEPDTTVTINKPATVELTCATIINRIPDLINARSGFILTSEMPELTYKIKDLNEYLNN